MTSVTSDGQVEFRFFRQNVASVSIVGDFNGWESQNLAMDSDGQGWWTASVCMKAGEYRFSYLADGQWFNDYASYGLERTNTGFKSILRVPPLRVSPNRFNNAKQVA